jgi:hypothetical protein
MDVRSDIVPYVNKMVSKNPNFPNKNQMEERTLKDSISCKDLTNEKYIIKKPSRFKVSAHKEVNNYHNFEEKPDRNSKLKELRELR